MYVGHQVLMVLMMFDGSGGGGVEARVMVHERSKRRVKGNAEDVTAFLSIYIYCSFNLAILMNTYHPICRSKYTSLALLSCHHPPRYIYDMA